MIRTRALKIVFLFVSVSAMNMQAQHFHMNLYPEGSIPNYKDVGEVEVWDTTDIVRVSKVQQPTLEVYLPVKKHRSGEAIIICPGGGYHILAYDFEGQDIAKYWNSKGVVAIVLKYRLPTSEAQLEAHKSPLLDAQRAVRMVRFHAVQWGIDPERIGVMGFSAGGHLASTVSTHFDAGDSGAIDPVERMSCRPDFSMLIYPVISFTESFQHRGSRKALVGENEDLILYYSNEKQVRSDTPPAILIHASTDQSVPPQNSIAYYNALHAHGIAAALYIYSEGRHGFGLATGREPLSDWPERCYLWLKNLK